MLSQRRVQTKKFSSYHELEGKRKQEHTRRILLNSHKPKYIQSSLTFAHTPNNHFKHARLFAIHNLQKHSRNQELFDLILN